MSLRYRHRILEHLSHSSYRPAPARAIARDLRVESDERGVFNATLDELVADGRIVIESDHIKLPSYADELVGRFKLNQRASSRRALCPDALGLDRRLKRQAADPAAWRRDETPDSAERSIL